MSAGFPWFSLYGHKTAPVASNSIILPWQKGRVGGRRLWPLLDTSSLITWGHLSQTPPCGLHVDTIGVDWITYLLLNQSLAKVSQSSMISLNQT